jgi:hypothetical protein
MVEVRALMGIQAQIRITYFNPDGSHRDWIDDQSLFMGLPLTVNVQDFFRPSWCVHSPRAYKDG